MRQNNKTTENWREKSLSIMVAPNYIFSYKS
jgi:hypothetical protein